MVVEGAPKLFAVVHELGERVDGWVAAWGMAQDDGVDVVPVDGRVRMALASPERAVRLFGGQQGVTARLVWVPDAA
jgi:hypothetical protein